MQTAAHLIGALFLALTTAVMTYAFDEVSLSFQAGTNFYGANAFLGFIVGWKTIGSRPGLGGPASITAGIRAAITLAFWAIVIYAIWNVIERLKEFYIKEIWGVFDSFMSAFLEYGSLLLNPILIVILVVGSCISGIAAGLANRFWS